MRTFLFPSQLLAWFRRHGRDLPWRKTKDPYAIWVSEIMLQQTQVSRVKDFYRRFLERFPGVEDLAQASWEEILEYWRGLGYYRRARHLHAAARLIVSDFHGQFPRDFQQLQKLPGIGSYTAAAIMSFAFDEDVVALDTNLRRIFLRFFDDKERFSAKFLREKKVQIKEIKKTKKIKKMWPQLSFQQQTEILTGLIPRGQGAKFNHALMDVGATICVARDPRCPECPLMNECAFAHRTTIKNTALSIRSDRKVAPRSVLKGKDSSTSSAPRHSSAPRRSILRGPIMKVAIGVIIRDGQVLISKRPPQVAFGGLWEFPGGKLEEGEDERSCLKRELHEELAIEVAVRPPFYATKVRQHGQNLQLSFHRCSILLGEPKALQVEEFRWVKPQALSGYTFPPVNQKVIELLLQKKAMFRS